MDKDGMALGELAQHFDLQSHGNAETRIRDVCSLLSGAKDCIAFVSDPAYLPYLADTKAGAVIVKAEHSEHAEQASIPYLISADPYLAFARIASYLQKKPAPSPGIHPTACVSESADIGSDVYIAAHVVIESGCRIGAGTMIGPGCTIGADCIVGEQVRLIARVTLCERVQMGNRVTVEPGAVLGSRGFGLAADTGGRWIPVPQSGRVVIGDDVEVGANTTIDRGALDDTIIGNGVKLDNQIQIGHNVSIGENTVISGSTGIAGSTRIGSHCMIGGQVGINDHVCITDHVMIAAKSGISKSITEPGIYSSAMPAQKASQWRKQLARLRLLEKLQQRMRTLEKTVKNKEGTED